MSMEIHVLFRGKLPTKPALAKAMKELGFPITIPPPKDSLEKQSGFLPMKLNGEHGGAEFDVFEGHANVAEIVGDREGAVDLSFDRSANFRFGGDENEMISAMCAAAALAKLVGGVVLDAESGELMSVDEAIASAKKHLGDLKPPERRFGTRPSDVKRILKPLLKLRNDLVLVDRLLLIRPVRHLIRGVYFDRTGKDAFRLWSYVNPLYAPAALGYGDYGWMPHCKVWQPHFEPLLIDSLGEDLFAEVGQIMKLSDFGSFSGPGLDRTFFDGTNVISLVLGGERDRAAEFVDQYLKGDAHTRAAKQVIQEQWERVSGDIEKVCEDFHAKEAATVKALKLELYWEPSPFPVELQAAERARVSEPPFAKVPWIGTPSWLYGEMPEQPGEVLFGKNIRDRNNRDLFVVPVTHEEAERRDSAGETYAIAERRADGSLLTASHFGQDLNDPDRWDIPDYRPYTRIYINWETSSHSLLINPSRDLDDHSMINWWSFSIRDRITGKKIWFSYVILREDKTTIYDSRSGEEIFSTRELTAAEREIARCPVPNFTDYNEVLRRALALLEMTGYGPWLLESPKPGRE